jgi:hypothetical protein
MKLAVKLIHGIKTLMPQMPKIHCCKLPERQKTLQTQDKKHQTTSSGICPT